MKILFALTIFLSPFVFIHPDASNISAVDAKEGIFIFWLSKPKSTFEVLATFPVKQKFTGEPKEQLKTALAKMHHDFPGANGLIFLDENMQTAQAVKLEE